MPWTNKQITAARIALAAKRGDIPVSKLKGASLSMYNSMSESQLEKFIGEGTKGE